MLATSLLALAAHPTLPTRWTAVVDESSVGIVLESYLMIDKPSKEAPSAKCAVRFSTPSFPHRSIASSSLP